MTTATIATASDTGYFFPWISIDPTGAIKVHRSRNLIETTHHPLRWCQPEVDRDMSALLDPAGTISNYRGRLRWIHTPGHGAVLTTERTARDPTLAPPNHLATAMLRIARNRHQDLFGPVAWIAGIDEGTYFYCPFTETRLARLRALAERARAALRAPSTPHHPSR